jgi:AraC-like DNA-binding protein
MVCPVDHCICASDALRESHRLVFTRAGAAISRSGEASAPAVLVDPTHVLLLSAGERYDVCHWSRDPHLCTTFGFAASMFAADDEQLLRLTARDGQFFRARRFLLGPGLLLKYQQLRRVLLEAASSGEAPSLAIEEEALTLLRATTLGASGISGRAASDTERAIRDLASVRVDRRRRDLAESAKMILADAPGATHRLGELATMLGVSPSHLAHVFRAQVGLPVHQYLLQIRMALALDELTGGAADLGRLAVDLGFATHSHFSAAFRQCFGVSPSRARNLLHVNKSCA